MTSISTTARKRNWTMRSMVGLVSIALVVGTTALYRFYQPITHPALLQFDIFDWMNRSRELMLFGKMTVPTSLWLFPTVNAWIAKIFGGDLFSVYLFSGATLTTLNVLLLGLIARMLWPKRILPIVMMILLYALNTQLLARSVNYLPETMTYTFGLTLVYCYLFLFLRKTWKIIPVILVLTYLFYHLHQSGLNFIVFTVLAITAYVAWLAPIRRRWRAAIISGGIMAVVGLFVVVEPLRQQFEFFINGSKNADVAFQGNAIPFEQIISDYPLIFVILLALGALIIMLKLFRKNSASQRLSYAFLLGIALFYFLFLYILPNLGAYSLVPWRFYTWFSLYAIIIATIGAVALFDRYRQHQVTTIVTLFFLGVSMFHGSLISDNMFTADRQTLIDMETIPVHAGVVVTTNANYLQTRFALAQNKQYVVYYGPEIFQVRDSETIGEKLRAIFGKQDIYVLISLYQLRQKPSSIDYWNNSAQVQMDVKTFQETSTFETVKKTPNILLVKLRS